jgi:hypothetical protein
MMRQVCQIQNGVQTILTITSSNALRVMRAILLA